MMIKVIKRSISSWAHYGKLPFCLSLASRYPDRIKSGILINPWYNPEAKGEEDVSNDGTPIPDSFVLKDDGSHLVKLHSKRSAWLDNDLNLRVVQSELTYLMNRRQRYRVEHRRF